MEGSGLKEHHGVRVAHAVPGRMRLHLNREWARLVPELVSRLRSRSEMRKVRWSPAARSLTVEFDPSLRQHEVLDTLANPSAREAIARRAYELYLERGATDGHDLNDWLSAERELKTDAKPQAQ